MTKCSWDDVGPFAPSLRWQERADRISLLAKACKDIRGTHEAIRLLGDPHNPERRAAAQRVLDTLPTRDRRTVLSRYQILSKEASS